MHSIYLHGFGVLWLTKHEISKIEFCAFCLRGFWEKPRKETKAFSDNVWITVDSRYVLFLHVSVLSLHWFSGFHDRVQVVQVVCAAETRPRLLCDGECLNQHRYQNKHLQNLQNKLQWNMPKMFWNSEVSCMLQNFDGRHQRLLCPCIPCAE